MTMGANALDNLVAAYLQNQLANSQGADQFSDSGRRHLFGQNQGQGSIVRDWRAGRQLQQGQAQMTRANQNLARAAYLDPTLADAVEQMQALPPAEGMSRSDNRSVAAIPDGYTDPTWLTIIPDQSLAAATALSVTTPPPSTYFAAYMLLSVSAGAQALFSVSAINIGGVPMVQGAGAFGADALNPASFNVAPVRRIIATSQPITISLTNNDAAARRVSSYFFGFLARTTLQNY